MLNKKFYPLISIGMLMISCSLLLSKSFALYETNDNHAPLTQYWNLIAQNIAIDFVSEKWLDEQSVYIDKKYTDLFFSGYIQRQLSTLLKYHNVNVTSPTNARYSIELDFQIRKRPNRNNIFHITKNDLDRSWLLKEIHPLSSTRRSNYKMVQLSENRSMTRKEFSKINTELLIFARIKERESIVATRNYAFYFNAKNKRGGKRKNKDVFLEFEHIENQFMGHHGQLNHEINKVINDSIH